MKACFAMIFICMLLVFRSMATDIIVVRSLLEKAWTDDKYIEEFSRSVRAIQKGKDAVLLGYQAMEYFMKAKYSMGPYTKLKLFREGKQKLEKAIAMERQNIELRFLRYSVQMNVPFFLDYSCNMKEDRSLLMSNWKTLQDADLKARISTFLVVNGKN